MVMYYTVEDYEPVDFPDENKRIFSSEDDKEQFEYWCRMEMCIRDRNNTISFYAPSKTFNLAGFVGSYGIIYNKYWRDRWNKEASLTQMCIRDSLLSSYKTPLF